MREEVEMVETEGVVVKVEVTLSRSWVEELR